MDMRKKRTIRTIPITMGFLAILNPHHICTMRTILITMGFLTLPL
jgi:hypothetical protein